ncbi:MAG: sigma-70 family RNA polymerase sigma factor [Pseudomonadota bacterium]
MDQEKNSAELFEANRAHLRAVAYRMLGSLAEADDAVQEAWLRLSNTGLEGVENPTGWLTTVVARICLDMLRQRKARREEPLDIQPDRRPVRTVVDPEQEALLAEAIGLALMVVLTRLDPAERIAFVLHDMFALPFEDIAPIVERSTDAARQLASRARRRVQGGDIPTAELPKQRAVVDAFLAASRANDLAALIAVLDPDVVFRGDATAVRMGGPQELRGAEAVARAFAGRAQAARTALLDGVLGLVVAPRGKLALVLRLTITGGRIAGVEAVADRASLENLELTVLA